MAKNCFVNTTSKLCKKYKQTHIDYGQEVDREKVDREHDDDGDQHLGHLPPGLELVIQVSVGRASAAPPTAPVRLPILQLELAAPAPSSTSVATRPHRRRSEIIK